MKHWLSAFRLRTLPLAVSSILVGSALASNWSDVQGWRQFSYNVLYLALLTAILLQVLSNIANDLGDHQHGADNNNRIGPERAVQSGSISPAACRRMSSVRMMSRSSSAQAGTDSHFPGVSSAWAIIL